jgi:hypothetical protein
VCQVAAPSAAAALVCCQLLASLFWVNVTWWRCGEYGVRSRWARKQLMQRCTCMVPVCGTK